MIIIVNGLVFKECPCCDEKVDVETLGTFIEIFCGNCGIGMSLQKSDALEREEESTWDDKNCVYDDATELKALKHIQAAWNMRGGKFDD